MVADDPESFADLDSGHLPNPCGYTGDWCVGSEGENTACPARNPRKAKGATPPTQLKCHGKRGARDEQNQGQKQEPVVVADDYTVDKFSHGGPHIDRVDDHEKLVGRYDENGNPIEFKGKKPPRIPKSDKKRFGSASDKLKEYKERVRKANEQGSPANNPNQKMTPVQPDTPPIYLPFFPQVPMPEIPLPMPEPIPIPV